MITPIRTMTINQIMERKDDLLVSVDDIKKLAKEERNKVIDDFADYIKMEMLLVVRTKDDYDRAIQSVNEIVKNLKGKTKL